MNHLIWLTQQWVRICFKVQRSSSVLRGDNNEHPEGCWTPKTAANDTDLWGMLHRKGNKIKGSNPMQRIWIQNNVEELTKRLVGLDAQWNMKFRRLSSLDLLLMLYSFWLLHLWTRLQINDFILKTMLHLGI